MGRQARRRTRYAAMAPGVLRAVAACGGHSGPPPAPKAGQAAAFGDFTGGAPAQRALREGVSGPAGFATGPDGSGATGCEATDPVDATHFPCPLPVAIGCRNGSVTPSGTPTGEGICQT